MKTLKIICVCILSLLLLASCKKTRELSQEERERTEPLQVNEVIDNEKSGLRFFITYTSGKADISLKIYRGTTLIPLMTTYEYSNYHILASSLADNTEFIIETEFNTVLASGSFKFEAEGYTAIRGTKTYTLPGNTFTTSDAGKKKNFLLMKKGIIKYSFFKL